MGLDPWTDLILDDDPDVDGTVLTVTRVNGLATNLSWTDSVTSKLMKTIAITRVSGLISQIVTSAYLQDGVTIGSQKTETFTRTAGRVTSVTTVRNV
jgi:hypothetical protein